MKNTSPGKSISSYIGLIVILFTIGSQTELSAQNKNVFKRIGKGISNLSNKSSSSSSRSSRSSRSSSSKKSNQELLKNVVGIGLIASEAYQSYSGNRLSSGQNMAINLAQGVTVESLDMKQFKSLSLTQQTSVTRNSRSQLNLFNATRETRYQQIRKSGSNKAEIDQERKQISEIRSEAENRLDLISQQVDSTAEGEKSDKFADLMTEAAALKEAVSHLSDLEGLFAGLSSRQHSISRDYVGSFLTEI